MNHRVLITGGTGFVCMNIAEKLLDCGLDVVLMARRPPREEAFRELSGKRGGLAFAQGDVLQIDAVHAAIQDYKVTDVIHGAALTPSLEAEIAHPRRIMEVNCIGLMNVLDEARTLCQGRFIYLGSISGYGRTCFTQKVLVEDESKEDPRSLYELSKFTGERIVQRYRDLFSMDAIVARVGDVFGPWERKTGVRSYMSFPYQIVSAALRGEEVVLPKPNCIDWVFGTDIAASVYELLVKSTLNYDVYPLCSGYAWPLTDWCGLVKERFPNFRWRMAEAGETGTIRVNQIEDNARMQTDRLIEETGYHPRFDMVRAFTAYMDWIDAHPGYVE